MQPDRPLLTIAIPTYNRSACLTQLLEALRPQLVGESRVELIVSDNASPMTRQLSLHPFATRDLR
jgi:glycosyltransferase involved in cell wall biosynthesis